MNATMRGTGIGFAADAIAAAALVTVGCSTGAPMPDQIQPVTAQHSTATADNSAACAISTAECSPLNRG